MIIDLKTLFGIDAGFDEKSTNALLKAINDAHLSEFDYIKFKASVQNLINLNMDEVTSIKSTFTTAQTMGVTKDLLLNTVQHYKNILSKEKNSFSTALAKNLDNSINSKVKENEDLKLKIVEFQNKIVELNKAIEEGTSKIANIDKEIDEIKNKIEITKSNFNKAIGHIESTIISDEQKLKHIL
jgi:predicted  nucleic acid-binding Zn-ribbon protein